MQGCGILRLQFAFAQKPQDLGHNLGFRPYRVGLLILTQKGQQGGFQTDAQFLGSNRKE